LKPDPVLRPLTWRLPLIAFLIVGFVGLVSIDRLLTREYREQGVTQAVQAQAFLESHLNNRVALLHGITSLLETSRSPGALDERFVQFARRVYSDLEDVHAIGYADARGVVRATYPPAGQGLVRRGANLRESVDVASALDEARFTATAAATRSLEVASDERGVILVEPIIGDDRVAGYITAVTSYPALFADALGGRLLGRFAYQVRDDAMQVIAQSPAFSPSFASVERRPVQLPGNREWTVEVAIPRLQPLVPRLVNWLVGFLLLALVVLLVVREKAQAERFAERTIELEILSRDLLDANLRLEERAQQIAEANRAKSRFLANVSHELRTPLNAIVGYNSLARDGVYGKLPDQLCAVHDRIAAAADHLIGLVDDVLDLSKIEVGRMAVEPQPVNIGALVDAVATVIEPMANAKRLHVDVVVARDVPEIETDPSHVRQILLNLASNAVKFTERGTVTIVARRIPPELGDGVVVIVEDTGIGIAPADQERIFQEFEQVRPSGRGDSLERGTGLGLAIARKLARLLGGDVQVQSVPNSGSRFILTLPLVSPPVNIAHDEPAPSTTPAAPGTGAAPSEPAADEPTRDRGEGRENTPPQVRALIDAARDSARVSTANAEEERPDRS
jgi:signal transduction histidine kinase